MAGQKGMKWRRPLASPTDLEEIRKKIQADRIAERLNKHALGEIEMEPTQITAALGLLKKTLPDLSTTQMTGDPTKPIHVHGEGFAVCFPTNAARVPAKAK